MRLKKGAPARFFRHPRRSLPVRDEFGLIPVMPPRVSTSEPENEYFDDGGGSPSPEVIDLTSEAAAGAPRARPVRDHRGGGIQDRPTGRNNRARFLDPRGGFEGPERGYGPTFVRVPRRVNRGSMRLPNGPGDSGFSSAAAFGTFTGGLARPNTFTDDVLPMEELAGPPRQSTVGRQLSKLLERVVSGTAEVPEKSPSSASLRGTLQARSKRYGTLLPPEWFVRTTDLGTKLKSLEDRRRARAALIGGPTYLIQKSAHEIRKRLLQGSDKALLEMRLDSRMTVATFIKAMNKVPIMSLLKWMKPKEHAWLKDRLVQQATDLDYLNDLIDSCSGNDALNLQLHAVICGFRRRASTGNFVAPNVPMDIDRLRFDHLATFQDSDSYVAAAVTNSNNRRQPPTQSANPSTSQRLCYAFQRGRCNRPRCSYRHECGVCLSTRHGASDCPRETHQNIVQQQPFGGESGSSQVSFHGPYNDRNAVYQDNPQRPPNPRYRRNRADQSRRNTGGSPPNPLERRARARGTR